MDRLTVTVPEMAEMLGIGRIKAYELANIKGFPAIRLGKRIVVPVDQLKNGWKKERARVILMNELTTAIFIISLVLNGLLAGGYIEERRKDRK